MTCENPALHTEYNELKDVAESAERQQNRALEFCDPRVQNVVQIVNGAFGGRRQRAATVAHPVTELFANNF